MICRSRYNTDWLVYDIHPHSPVLLQVALFAENSGRWTIADQGIMMNGAADAVGTL